MFEENGGHFRPLYSGDDFFWSLKRAEPEQCLTSLYVPDPERQAEPKRGLLSSANH